MLYLSGTYSQILPQYRDQFGYMLNVNQQIGGELEAMQYPWMLDNGAFSQAWRYEVWYERLAKLAAFNANCIAAVVPDVILDARVTLTRWFEYAPLVKALGYKAAFATQNGCTVDMIPWSEIDVLFIGGSDEHRKRECWPLIDEAKRRGLWVHVGRVNSAANIMRYCKCDSVDGTTFRFTSYTKKIEGLLWAVRRCNARKCQQGQLFMQDSLALLTPS